MRLIITIIIGFSIASCATIPITFNESEYMVKTYDSLAGNKDQLFLKANGWMIKTFTNAASVIQHSDKEDGVIIGKYLMGGQLSTSMYGSADSRVFAIIDVRVKDQKARIEIKPQGPWQYDNSGMTIFNYSKEQAISDMKLLTKSFHKALSEKTIDF